MTKYYITPKGKDEPRIEVFALEEEGSGYFTATLAPGVTSTCFDKYEWTLHTEQPTLAEVLDGLGEMAYIVNSESPATAVKASPYWYSMHGAFSKINPLMASAHWKVAFAGHGVDPESIPEEWRL